MRHDPVNAIVLELARYLSANPDASDTADGIARWWLPLGTDRGTLMLALGWMTQQGYIEVVQATDGHVRYRRRGRPVAAGDPLRLLIDSIAGSGDAPSAGETH